MPNCEECGWPIEACDCEPERSAGSLERAGSASPDQSAHKLREAMNAMEQEQWDDYQEYVKRCGGVPISKIPASRPVRPNAELSNGGEKKL